MDSCGFWFEFSSDIGLHFYCLDLLGENGLNLFQLAGFAPGFLSIDDDNNWDFCGEFFRS